MMVSHCPKCNKPLSFNENQLDRIQSALAAMSSGTLKLKCPHCKVPMELLSDGTLADWRQKPIVAASSRKKMPEPPRPPDINWLTESVFKEEEVIKDIPKVLVLIDPGPIRDRVMGAMVESFSQPVAVETRSEAVTQLQVVQFDSVILHSSFDGESFKHSRVHEIMKHMPMNRRRYIFYVLIGPEFSTLYSLEALSYSANMVVNEKDVEYMKNIYKRGKHETDELFGPYANILKERGVGGS
jgi:phage FluMu protein Com